MSMETTSSQSTTLVSTVVETSQSCVYEGRDYEHGDYFQPVYNPCLNCSCVRGRVRCVPVRCADPEELPCPKPVKTRNSCCLACPGKYESA